MIATVVIFSGIVFSVCHIIYKYGVKKSGACHCNADCPVKKTK